MKKLLVALLMTASIAHAAETDWVVVASNNNLVYSIKKGSAELSKNDGGEPIILGIGNIKNTSSNASKLEVWYVEIRACLRQFGKLYSADSDGRVQSTIDFAFGQGTIAAGIGEALCYSANRQLNTNPTNLKGSV